eukprot:3466695-Pyramimonas_sp.AAC.1
MTNREWEQVAAANDLYRTTLLFAYVAAATAAAGIVEHPAPPRDPMLPSSWSLPETSHIIQLLQPD